MVCRSAQGVLRDMHAVQEHLATVHLTEAVDERGPTGTQRLDLGAGEHQTCLVGVLDEVVVSRLLVLRDRLMPLLLDHENDCVRSDEGVLTPSQPGHRVNGHAVLEHHEVEVTAGRETGGADVTDDLAPLDPFPDVGRVGAEMVVRRTKPDTAAETVVHDHPLAVTGVVAVSYTHLRAHETDSYLVCRLLLEKKK